MKSIRLASIALLMVVSVTFAANAVDVHAYIVAKTDGSEATSPAHVVECINDLNLAYSQIGIPFSLMSCNLVVSNEFYDVVYTNAQTWTALCDYAKNTGGLELYFVGGIDGTATAFYTRKGIVISQQASARTVSHEVGHAFGWKDIFTRHSQTALLVEGPPSQERMPTEWSPFYPRGTMQADLIPKLLMFGQPSSSKLDIPGGDIYGLWYTNRRDVVTGRWVRDWQLSLAPVGIWNGMNRNPQSE